MEDLVNCSFSVTIIDKVYNGIYFMLNVLILMALLNNLHQNHLFVVSLPHDMPGLRIKPDNYSTEVDCIRMSYSPSRLVYALICILSKVVGN